MDLPQEVLVIALHAAIMEANAKGQPRGVTLSASPTPASGSSPLPEVVDTQETGTPVAQEATNSRKVGEH